MVLGASGRSARHNELEKLSGLLFDSLSTGCLELEPVLVSLDWAIAKERNDIEW